MRKQCMVQARVMALQDQTSKVLNSDTKEENQAKQQDAFREICKVTSACQQESGIRSNQLIKEV